MSERHPFRTFGPANYVTTFRAALPPPAPLIGEARIDAVAWAAAGIGAATTALDAVDGWLARRTSMASVFGARYDMELDALLIMVLAVIAWQAGKAGAWVLLAGAMRYLFVAAAYLWHWLDSPLPASGRRKAVCVIQIVGLGVAVSPFVAATASAVVAAGTLALLTWSFGVDVLWLRRHGGDLRRLLSRIFAVVLLDASITFSNVWPTPLVKWTGAPSVELAVLLLGLAFAFAGGRVAPSSRRLVRWLSVVWLLLILGRYIDVTAPALWGRDLNFYWDLRFLPDVAAMLVGASRRAVLLGTVAGIAVVAVLGLLFVAVRWAVGQVTATLAERRGRIVLGAAATLGVALFALQAAGLFGLESAR